MPERSQSFVPDGASFERVAIPTLNLNQEREYSLHELSEMTDILEKIDTAIEESSEPAVMDYWRGKNASALESKGYHKKRVDALAAQISQVAEYKEMGRSPQQLITYIDKCIASGKPVWAEAVLTIIEEDSSAWCVESIIDIKDAASKYFQSISQIQAGGQIRVEKDVISSLQKILAHIDPMIERSWKTNPHLELSEVAFRSTTD